jgi:hypothetical protein
VFGRAVPCRAETQLFGRETLFYFVPAKIAAGVSLQIHSRWPFLKSRLPPLLNTKLAGTYINGENASTNFGVSQMTLMIG